MEKWRNYISNIVKDIFSILYIFKYYMHFCIFKLPINLYISNVLFDVSRFEEKMSIVQIVKFRIQTRLSKQRKVMKKSVQYIE